MSELDTPAKVATRLVEAGAQLLDLYGPAEWRGKIDLQYLDMEDGFWCVLGQVYADKATVSPWVTGYSYGKDVLSLKLGRFEDEMAVVEEHGFSTLHNATTVTGVTGPNGEWFEVTGKDLAAAWGELLNAAR